MMKTLQSPVDKYTVIGSTLTSLFSLHQRKGILVEVSHGATVLDKGYLSCHQALYLFLFVKKIRLGSL